MIQAGFGIHQLVFNEYIYQHLTPLLTQNVLVWVLCVNKMLQKGVDKGVY